MIGLEGIEWDKIADALQTYPIGDKPGGEGEEEAKTETNEERVKPVLSVYLPNLNEESKIQLTEIEASNTPKMVSLFYHDKSHTLPEIIEIRALRSIRRKCVGRGPKVEEHELLSLQVPFVQEKKNEYNLFFLSSS